ncbi:hypothetical protein V1511DRAFT_144016 [Dipodascopsis uninucleata]
MSSPPPGIYDVPPKHPTGKLPEQMDIDINQSLPLTLDKREYATIFWINDAKLSKKDRFDVLKELDRSYVYQIFGAFTGAAALGTVGYFLSTRYFRPTRRSLTAFFSIIGAEFGTDIGFQIGLSRAQSDFSSRPHCRAAIRLIEYRPTLTLWRNYYGGGKPLSPFTSWWNTNYDNILLENSDWRDTDAVADMDDSGVEFTSDKGFETSGSLSWNIPVSNNRTDKEASATAVDRESKSQPKTEVDQNFYGRFNTRPEMESQEDFDRKIQLERQGEDQPDDFVASERKYSRSKYD